MAKLLFLMLKFALLWWWSSIPRPGACLQNQTDRLALASFKDAIHEDPFGVLSSWNDSTPHCEWQGVLCSKRHPGRVTSLLLRSQGLGGFLSPHIGNLSFLRVLVLQNNSFHGEIPPQIGNLFWLRDLELSNNSFGGSLPSNLSHCSNLEILNLIDNQLVGVIHSNLGSLPRLEKLGLTKNSLVGPIPPSIGNLSLLQVLSLSTNSLHGEIPQELSRLERLYLFQLSFNKLTGEIPSGIFNISDIIIFSVMKNQLRGSFPSDIGTTLPSIIWLVAAGNLFTGTIPSSLTNATSLQVLDFSHNIRLHGPISKDLGRLKGLQLLSLSNNKLQDDLSFISSLANCSHLKILDLQSNLIHGSLPRSISNLSTSIKRIYLGDNQIQGTIPSGLPNLCNLSLLALDNKFLTGPLPESIGALYSMEQLFLGENRFTGEIPPSIGNMTSLYLLDLRTNHFQGDIPQSLGNCQQLAWLNLSNNNLIGLVPFEIMGLSLSISFSLAHNNLNGSLPLQVGSLINLEELDLSYNGLTGLIPASISMCLRLERLRLEANSFHGQIPQALSPLRGLQELDLSNNNFSGSIPSFLTELSQLKYLNLSFNQLEGRVPEGGVFLNASAVSISGNRELCGGVMGLKLPLCKVPSSNKSSSTKAIVISAVAVGLLCLALLFLSIRCYCKMKKQTRIGAKTSSSFEHQFLRISYEELLRATNRFSETNLIGKGRYGTVYKGNLDGGVTVAVKVLNLNQRGALRSFISECQTLGAIRHRNLVKILSVCSGVDFRGNDFKALIYEFMANESLEEWLHPRTIDQDDDEHADSRDLRLVQRLNIAIDIATAIEYLHKGCYRLIVHGDLKPSNVLLDNDMVTRVGDFGLAKIISTVSTEATGIQDQGSSTSTAVRGSVGYVPPEYGMGHKISTLGDAYSYGILLLEMFTGKRPTEDAFGLHFNLHSFVRMALPNRAMDVVDSRLLSEAGDQQLETIIRDCSASVLEVGVACSMESPRDRMDMTKAIKELHAIKVSYETKQRSTRM